MHLFVFVQTGYKAFLLVLCYNHDNSMLILQGVFT